MTKQQSNVKNENVRYLSSFGCGALVSSVSQLRWSFSLTPATFVSDFFNLIWFFPFLFFNDRDLLAFLFVNSQNLQILKVKDLNRELFFTDFHRP